MEKIIKLIFFILLAIIYSDTATAENCAEASAESTSNRTICRRYSKSASKFMTWDCGEHNDFADGEEQNGGVLEYGHTYKGIGRISTPEECARTCEEGAPPKHCYYKFTVEMYRTLGGACNVCHPTTNTSLSRDCQCVLADGVDIAGKLMVNRMYPGPSIQVCIQDMVIVDVHNQMTGNGLTIHWHGIYQNGWQHYDGVPFVTQCPILYGQTFRYKWRAQNAGTHFYHGHTGFHQQDGIEGAIIIRVPRSQDDSSAYYDEDRFDTIMSLKDWMHPVAQDHWPGTTVQNAGQYPDNILINGKGQWFNSTSGNFTDVPLAVFNVEPNRRYRFRMINMFSWLCSVRLTIQDHDLTIVASDGENVKPQRVTTIISSAAERYDFVINTNQDIGSYWIEARLIGAACVVNITQVAILRYTGSKLAEPRMNRPLSSDSGLPLGIVFNPLDRFCDNGSSDTVCVKNLHNTEAPHRRIFAERADISLYLPITFHLFTDAELFRPHTYKNFESPSRRTNLASLISNISHVFPPSPYLTQFDDIPPDTICDSSNKPEECDDSQPCYCSHLVRSIPLNSVVELVLVDGARVGLSHPFHLHGYGFHVMARGNLSEVNLTRANKYQALQLHAERYGKLNPLPPVKDTYNIINNSYTIVRFIADNPGYWFYHCHFRTHQISGMEMTLQIGEPEDLPPTPEGFPTCRNFVPNL